MEYVKKDEVLEILNRLIGRDGDKVYLRDVGQAFAEVDRLKTVQIPDMIYSAKIYEPSKQISPDENAMRISEIIQEAIEELRKG